MKVSIAALLTLLFGAVSAIAASSPGAASLNYGYFCAVEPIDEAFAEGTISGTVSFVADVPSFISEGSLVPAQLGIGFGVHVRALPEFAGPVTVYIEHPPMGPNGVTKQVWETSIGADEPEYLGYTFDMAYELVTGSWSLSAEAENGTVYSVDFEVLDAGLMPPTPCGATPLS
ncbi:MAG: DUF3859 domain-containing protein [Pseudomonadota bacterium]